MGSDFMDGYTPSADGNIDLILVFVVNLKQTSSLKFYGTHKNTVLQALKLLFYYAAAIPTSK